MSSEIERCKELAEGHLAWCREKMRGWKGIEPIVFVHLAESKPIRMPIPDEYLERWNEPAVRFRTYEVIRRLVRELPVPLEFVSFIGDAWMCRLNERGREAKADVADKSTDWLVENGYGNRWEVVIVRVECKYGGYHLNQPYVRRTGRMYFEGPSEGHEYLLGEEAGQQSFFTAPRPMKEMLEKERKPS